MNVRGNQFTYAGTRLFVTAVALAATLTFSSGIVLAVEKDIHQDRTELRIKDMHAKLKITSAQEEQWSKVAAAMNDNAKVMDALTEARFSHMKDMTAIDDLKSYGEITDAHAEGIKRLTPVFATLYESMSAAQKKEADTLFRHVDRKHGHEKARSDK